MPIFPVKVSLEHKISRIFKETLKNSDMFVTKSLLDELKINLKKENIDCEITYENYQIFIKPIINIEKIQNNIIIKKHEN